MADNSDVGIKVGVDASGATDGAREFKRSADDIASSAKKASESASSLSESFKRLGEGGVGEVLEGIKGSIENLHSALQLLGIGAIAYEFKELIEVGKQLEDAFTHLQVVSGSTDQVMQKFRATTEALSTTFGRGQLQVAAAQLEAARSGYQSLSDNAKVASASIELSKVAFTDVGSAASLLTRIMQSYGQSADQAKETSAELFVATRQGKLDIQQLTQVFGRIEPFVQETGLSIKEILGTLSALGQTGQDVRVSMYGMQQILSAIAQPTTSAAQAFQLLQGAFDQVGVHATSLKDLVGQKGLIGALQLINQVSGGNQEVLKQMFGSIQAGATAFTLANQAGKVYTQTMKEMDHAQQELGNNYRTVTNTVSEQTEQFRQRIQAAFLDVADTILNVLGPTISTLNKNFGAVESVATLLAGALAGRLIVALISAGTSMIATAGAAGVLEAALALLGGPVGIIALVVGGLIAFGIHAYSAGDASDALKKKVDELSLSWDSLGEAQRKQLGVDLNAQVKTLQDNIKNIEASKKALESGGGISAAGGTYFGMGSESDHNAKMKALDQGLARNKEKLAEVQQTLKQYNDIVDQHTKSQTAATTAVTQQTKALTDQQKALQALNDAANEQQSLISNVIKQPVQEQQLQQLIQAYQSGSYATSGNPLLGGGPTGATISGGQRGEIIGALQKKLFEMKDAETEYQRALEATEGKTDPVIQATLNYTNSLRALKEAAAEARVSVKSLGVQQAEAQLKQKEQQDVIAGHAKLADQTATTGYQKQVIDTTAKQQEALVPLTAAVEKGTISWAAYNEVLKQNAIDLEELAIKNAAVTDGQRKLMEAQEAQKQAALKAQEQGLQGQALVDYMAQFSVATAEAAQQSDGLGREVGQLTSQYIPLVGILQKYRDEQAKMQAIAQARPDLAPQIAAAQPIAQATLQKDVDAQIIQPAQAKAATTALDDYRLALAKLNEQVAQGTISTGEYDEVVQELQQTLAKQSSGWSDFAAAAQDAGKAASTALDSYFINPSRRGIQQLAKSFADSMRQSASKLLSDQLMGKLWGGLANVGGGIGTFAKEAAAGSGVQLGGNQGGGTAGAAISKILGGDKGAVNLNTAGTQLISAAAALKEAASSIGGKGGTPAGGGMYGGLSEVTPTTGSLGTSSDQLGFVTPATGSLGGGSSGSSMTASTLESAGVHAAESGVSTGSTQGIEQAAEKEGVSLAGTAVENEAKNINWSGLMSDFAGFFAGGGDISGGSTAVVGEHGAELISTGSNAHVTSNDQIRAAMGGGRGNQAAPAPHVTVPVQVVNVSDPSQVPAAMQGAAGTKAIMNVLGANRSAVNSVLGNS